MRPSLFLPTLLNMASFFNSPLQLVGFVLFVASLGPATSSPSYLNSGCYSSPCPGVVTKPPSLPSTYNELNPSALSVSPVSLPPPPLRSPTELTTFRGHSGVPRSSEAVWS